MEIFYKTTKHDRFDSKIEYLLDVDIPTQEIEWIIYPHAPKSLHFKAADQYGLGGKYHNGKQSLKDFYANPSYEIDPIKKELIFMTCKDAEDIDDMVTQIQSLIYPQNLKLTKSIILTFCFYELKLDEQVLFRISTATEEEHIKLDLFSYAF